MRACWPDSAIVALMLRIATLKLVSVNCAPAVVIVPVTLGALAAPLTFASTRNRALHRSTALGEDAVGQRQRGRAVEGQIQLRRPSDIDGAAGREVEPVAGEVGFGGHDLVGELAGGGDGQCPDTGVARLLDRDARSADVVVDRRVGWRSRRAHRAVDRALRRDAGRRRAGDRGGQGVDVGGNVEGFRADGTIGGDRAAADGDAGAGQIERVAGIGALSGGGERRCAGGAALGDRDVRRRNVEAGVGH